MDGEDLAAVVDTGKNLFSNKLFMTSMHFLWVYDYFLTLGDELDFAWSGKKSRLFALFIAIRYIPMLYIIWVNVALFHYSKSFCQETKWIMFFYTTTVIALAQIVITLRVYAVTGRKKSFSGALALMVAAQFFFAIYYTVRIGLDPMELIPEIDLDMYKFCIPARDQTLELVFTIQIIVFDVLAFAIIVSTAKRTRMSYPGIPSLLDVVLRDATVYFMLIFACQFCLVFFLFLAPAPVRFMPGIASMMFIPTMASRLMLSLKKASVEPKGPWYFSTMSSAGGRGSPESGNLGFTPQTSSGTREVRETLGPLPSNEGVIELDFVLPLSQHRESRLS